MLTAQIEDYVKCEPELREIYPQHWAELAPDGARPLDPNYEAYAVLAANNCILLVTLRDGGKLAGYFIGFLFPQLHHQKYSACTEDNYYVLPEYRKGSAGTQLFRAVERELRRRGVHRWNVASSCVRSAAPLLRRIGFTKMEELYSKELTL